MNDFIKNDEESILTAMKNLCSYQYLDIPAVKNIDELTKECGRKYGCKIPYLYGIVDGAELAVKVVTDSIYSLDYITYINFEVIYLYTQKYRYQHNKIPLKFLYHPTIQAHLYLVEPSSQCMLLECNRSIYRFGDLRFLYN